MNAKAHTARASGAPLDVILHTPKCAGSTIRLHLTRHLGADRFWAPSRRLFGFPQELLARKYVRQPHAPTEQIRAVSGHYLGRSIERLFPGRAIRRSIQLRSPYDLAISWYNFRVMRRMTKGEPPQSFRRHLLSLPVDPISHFILANWLELPWPRLAAMSTAEKFLQLSAAFEDIHYVGDISDTDAFLQDLCQRMDLPKQAARVNTSESWRERTNWRLLKLEDLSDGDWRLLEARSKLDQAIYSAFVERRRLPPPDKSAAFLPGELKRTQADLARRAHVAVAKPIAR